MARVCIPDYEYKERVQRCAAILRRENLDVLIVNGNEADYANPRYFSGFWPLFERAGVAIAANGDAALMVGPESAVFGADRNKLDKTFVDNSNKPKLHIFLKGTIRMLKDMDMEIVVEGIETEQMVETFSDLNCDFIQGYYYSKPIPKNDFIRFIEEAKKSA